MHLKKTLSFDVVAFILQISLSHIWPEDEPWLFV